MKVTKRHRAPVRPKPTSSPVKILVGLLVISAAAISLAAVMPARTGSVAKSAAELQASDVACASMGRLLRAPHDAPDLTAGTHAASEPSPGYYQEWTVEDDEPIRGCKRITVTVRWPSATSGNAVRLVEAWTGASENGQ